MSEKQVQHIGDDQLVHGMPKRMVGVVTFAGRGYVDVVATNIGVSQLPGIFKNKPRWVKPGANRWFWE